MKVVTVVGLRNSRESARAAHLAEFLLEWGQELTRSEKLFVDADFGGSRVRIVFSQNDALSQLIAGSFFPAQTDGETTVPRQTITVIRAEDGVVLPNLEWAQHWIKSNEVIPRRLTGINRIFIDRNHGVIYVYNSRTGVGSVYLRTTSSLDIRTFITPFRVLLSWLFEAWGGLVLHAAVCRVDGVGVLLSGPSGSGKSTLALNAASLPVGAIVSDDCILVHNSTAHAIFTRAKKVVSGPNVSLAPNLTRIRGRHRAKETLFLPSDTSPFERSTPIDLLVFPNVFGRQGQYRLTPSEAKNRLSTDSLREVLGGDEWQRQRMETFAESVPGYRLLLGPSDAENLANLRALVAGTSKEK